MSVIGCLQHLPESIRETLKYMDPRAQMTYVQEQALKGPAKTRQVIIHANKMNEIINQIGQAGPDLKANLESLISSVGKFRKDGYPTLHGTIETTSNILDRQMTDLLEAHRPGLFGRIRDAKAQRNIIREMSGIETGDSAAKGFAKSVKQMTDLAMDLFNQAGGAITKLKDFMVPMRHAANKIGKVPFDTWMADIRGNIKMDRFYQVIGVVDPKSISEVQVRGIFKQIYDKLSTDGYIDPSQITGTPNLSRAIGDMHQEHRLFHFKDGNSWLKYFDKYGDGDIFSSINSYKDIMAREIGAMQFFGPHPDRAVNELVDFAAEQTMNKAVGNHFMNSYKTVMGHLYGTPTPLGNIMQNLRLISLSAHIGMSAIASFGDRAFSGATYKMMGLPVVRGQMNFLNNLKSSKNVRLNANKMMFGSEYAMSTARTASKLTEMYGSGPLKRLAEGSVRGSGLHHWATTGKSTFQVDMAQLAYEQRNIPYNALPKESKRFMETYGIEEKHWNTLRAAPVGTGEGGLQYLDWSTYRSPDQLDALRRYVGGVVEETHMASMEPNPRIKAILNQGQVTGTPTGEMIRTGGMFKSFPVTTAVMQYSRATSLGPQDRLFYLGSLIGGTTLLGMMSIQASEILKGNDPYPMDSPDLLYKGFMQGSVFGIVQDFVFADDQFGAWASMLGGPVVRDADMFGRRFVLGTMRDVMTLQEDLQKEAVNNGVSALKGISPFKMWYTRVAIDRSIEAFGKMLQPGDYAKKQQAVLKRMRTEQGRDKWWTPGESTPSRVPEMGMPEF